MSSSRSGGGRTPDPGERPRRPRPARPGDDRPRAGRPREERPRDERPRDDRARDRPRDDRPRDDRARDDRARDQRPRDERPGGQGPRERRTGARGPRDEHPGETSRDERPRDESTREKRPRRPEPSSSGGSSRGSSRGSAGTSTGSARTSGGPAAPVRRTVEGRRPPGRAVRPERERHGGDRQGQDRQHPDRQTPNRQTPNRQAANRQGPDRQRAQARDRDGRDHPRRPPVRRVVRAPRTGPPPRRPARMRVLGLGDPRRRLRVGLVAIGFVLTLFAGRLVQLQVIDAPAYAADANRSRLQPVTLPAERGSIVDANGVTLATSVDAYDITADPAQAQKYDPRATATAIAPLVGGDPAAIEQLLLKPKSRYVVLAPKVDPEVWNRIKALKREYEQAGRDDLRAIYSTPHSRRVYPAGPVAANIVGFVNAEGRGGGGLELALDEELAGRDGRMTYEVAAGRRVPTGGNSGTQARPGDHVQLTIDRNIQWYAEQMIAAKVAEARAESGTVVVQDVRTGEILAMATAPGFDPNLYNRANPADMGNRALQEAYEPGSTSKVMTMAAVLEEGRAGPLTNVTVPGTLPRADRVFHDDVDHDTWHLTLNGVLAKSSNIGTILAAEQLGATQPEANAKLYEYLKRFGIGDPSGLGFPGETAGILPKPEKWDAAQQYTIPFGQGLSVNSLQATSVFQTIANNGMRIPPTLVKGTTGPDGRFSPAPAPEPRYVVSPQTARTVSDMMESVVADDEGTGNRAQIPGYRVAGKTGTANRVDPRFGGYNGYTSSFIGFAPADDPRIVVSVTIQAPTNGKWGGTLCAPVFKDVMSFALQTRKVPPTGTQGPELPVEW